MHFKVKSDQNCYFFSISKFLACERPVTYTDFYREQVNFICPSHHKHEFWIGTEKGLSLLNIQTGLFSKDIPLQLLGSDSRVEGFTQGMTDDAGALWLSSTSRQLLKLDFYHQQFKHLNINLLEHLSGARQLFELYEYSPGVLLVPHENGAVLLNIFTGQQTNFPYKPTENAAGWATGLTCFLEEKNGRLWMGTGSGLFLFDKNKNRFIYSDKRFDIFSILKGTAIRAIHRDGKNNLWVATWNKGVFKFNTSDNTFKQYNNRPEDAANNMTNARSILETRTGEMWFGTRGGLFKYIASADSFLVYKHKINQPESISENTAFCMYEDAKSNIWCGTYGGGLNELDIQKGTFQHFTRENGLLNNNVFSLLPDQQGNLWLLGYDGISKFQPATGTFRIYTHEYGLLNKEYDAFLYGKSRYSNLFFFCGKKGIDYFNPDSIQPSKYDPHVWITDFKLFNESVPIARNSKMDDPFSLQEDISFSRHLQLRYDQNVITFDYVALDYSSPNTIQYAYQLVGFDKDWQFVGNKHSVTFTNLDPGAYFFQVKASNCDGIWGSKIASVTLTVLPPWWRTWWFISMVLLSISALIIAFYRYRIRQIREKSALNQRIAEAKMEALQSQMNPHFIYNCLSSLKLYVEKNETEKASYYINKFATLMREILNNARSELISLQQELETLMGYVEMEKMRYKEQFDFQVDIHPDVPVQDIKIPSLLIQPYVENAIWHGLQHKKTGKGLLLLQVSMRNGKCEVMVEDNGIGRSTTVTPRQQNNTLHPSHGLNITAERIDFYNKKYTANAKIEIVDLKDAAGCPEGTRVILTF